VELGVLHDYIIRDKQETKKDIQTSLPNIKISLRNDKAGMKLKKILTK